MRTLADRFRAKVDVNGPTMPGMSTPCHIWTGATHISGYGVMGLGLKTVRVHRVAFFLENGRWPEPCACHRCDNRPCVRADHLFEGDKFDNMQDCARKLRCRTSKLTPQDVGEILSSLSRGETALELSRRFGVTRRTIYDVRIRARAA